MNARVSLIIGIALAGLVACKKEDEAKLPQFVETQSSTLSLRDVEKQQAIITYAKTQLSQPNKNTILKEYIEAKNIAIDFSMLQKKVVDFQQDNPSVELYFRTELREFQEDITSAGGIILRAGKPIGGNGIFNPFTVKANTLTDWAQITPELKKAISGALQFSLENQKKYKLVLSVYDLNRFIVDKSAFFETPIQDFTPHEKGGYFVAVLGWNAEIK
jgi:hypothetical protein